MKRIFLAIVLTTTLSLHAATTPRGGDRLRELVVFPEISFNFNWGIGPQNNEWVIDQTVDLSSAIAEQREKLKREPDDVKQLMQLGYLLDQNDETNESQSSYKKAEQICRKKIAANPNDGLSLTELGTVLDALGKKDEAEHDFRKATQVSSNEWQCWVGLGNFLSSERFVSMFPTNMWSQAIPGQIPPKEVLDYRPSPESLKKAETACQEASQCFNRAIAIAPKESEVFFQQAGYMSVSNFQSCFFRHYHNNEEIDTNEWVSSFFSPETIANLKKAADLKPKDYQYISLAAYFEWARKAIQRRDLSFNLSALSGAPQQFIQDAMTRLKVLSKDSNKEIAAGAFENLGMLNMMFQNTPEAITDFRQALALDPTRKQSWDLLLGSMFWNSASPDELLAVAQARLKIDGSARNHIVLSKILAQKMSRWKEAAEQAEIAQKLETNNIVPPLLLAAIALKQSEQTNYLVMARTNLIRAYIITKKMPDDDEKRRRGREWWLNTIIFDVLNNQPKQAKSTINDFLKYFPDDKTAEEILKMLG